MSAELTFPALASIGLGLFLFLVFLWGPERLPDYKRKMLGFSLSIFAGLLAGLVLVHAGLIAETYRLVTTSLISFPGGRSLRTDS